MEQWTHRLDERASQGEGPGCAVDHSQTRGQAVTAKARLRGLVEALSEPEAEAAVAEFQARPRWAGDSDERRRVMRAGLARLAELTIDLPPVDAVAVSRQSREALEGRLAE
ncbi:MAG: hypothetical protein M0027_08520 [Candidatus Dormibacteraeota bacterium]|nr:hypothetical protein [Candidatus Dormibacteraeota bacterium]